MSSLQTQFMQRAVQIAHTAGKEIKSNPKVGCVIVLNDKIISEAAHYRYGEAHAEINAIELAIKNGYQPSEKWEFYVTLEPCAHTGKTPPCAEKIFRIKPAKVYIGSLDQNPLVNGKGKALLQNAGIETIVLPVEGLHELTQVFYKNLFTQQPYTVLKWAQTANGKMGATNQRIKISNALSDILVHKWRAAADAILIGSKTLEIDDPLLNVRLVAGTDPRPIILTSQNKNELKKYKVFKSNPDTVIIPVQDFQRVGGEVDWKQILKYLYKQYHICRLLIEGGSVTLNSLIYQKCFDEIRLIRSEKIIQEANISAPNIEGCVLAQNYTLMNDIINIYNIDK